MTLSSESLKPANALLFLLLAVFAYFLYLYTRDRFLSPISLDEELFIWCGWLLTQGSVPYRDFFEPKPPVIFFANYLGLLLFGLKDCLYRVVPTVLALASISVFYVALLKRKVLPWLVVLLTAQVALWLRSGCDRKSSLRPAIVAKNRWFVLASIPDVRKSR